MLELLYKLFIGHNHRWKVVSKTKWCRSNIHQRAYGVKEEYIKIVQECSICGKRIMSEE